MIKSLILYYLSLKPTHGYEIQKFIQLNHMDSWTKIQSGSIYYALGKLEKEGFIELYKEESTASKVRKIYSITEKGKKELVTSLQEELDKSVYDIGSDKFIIYPLLGQMSKEDIAEHVTKHIQQLELKRKEVEEWRDLKRDEAGLKIEAICFEMMLSSLDYQMKWHKTLLLELDQCLNYSEHVSELIQQVDFSSINSIEEIKTDTKVAEINRLKKEILENPEEAAEKLEKLIQMVQG